jgi:hypothetical protein
MPEGRLSFFLLSAKASCRSSEVLVMQWLKHTWPCSVLTVAFIQPRTCLLILQLWLCMCLFCVRSCAEHLTSRTLLNPSEVPWGGYSCYPDLRDQQIKLQMRHFPGFHAQMVGEPGTQSLVSVSLLLGIQVAPLFWLCWNWNSDLAVARQVLYHLNHAPPVFFCFSDFSERVSCFLL